MRKQLIALAIVVVSACGTEPGVGDDDSSTPPYPEVPSDTQRAGDPAKGYDYLLNGGYVNFQGSHFRVDAARIWASNGSG